ncbi:MAG: acyltransferase family protein [Promethearchaeota archaeon]
MATEVTLPPRLDWIEVAKGIGITFVVLVHSMIPWLNPVTIHLSSFTIPLFFVLGGLTYNNERHRGDLRSFAISRGKQFLIPYFCLYALMMGLFVPLSPSIDTALTPSDVLFWFLYGNGPPLSASHLWFLPVMYFGLMAFVVADKLMRNLPSNSRLILIVIFPLLAVGIQALFHPNLVPWRVSGILISATFALFGNIMRDFRGLGTWMTRSRVDDFAAFIILSVLLILVSSLNGFTDIAVDNFGVNVYLYLAAGLTGTTIVFLASGVIAFSSRPKNLFKGLGKNSQELYEIHPVAFYIVPLIGVILSLPLGAPELHDMLWPARFFLGVAVGFVLTKYVITRNRILSVIFRGSPRTISTEKTT